MATGYTACIEKGISFPDFVKQCARAFGPCIMERDDALSPNLKMREEDATTKYHRESIASNTAEIKRFKAMDDVQRHEYGVRKIGEWLTDARESLQKKVELKKKYDDMLAKVNAWTPPSPDHQGLKDFMVKQITESIDWDCNPKYDDERVTTLMATAYDSIVPEQIKSLERSIAYHTEQLQKEKDGVKFSNGWKQQLIDSLK